jgi:hypothetical protein
MIHYYKIHYYKRDFYVCIKQTRNVNNKDSAYIMNIKPKRVICDHRYRKE